MLRSGVKALSRINDHESQDGAEQMAAGGVRRLMRLRNGVRSKCGSTSRLLMVITSLTYRDWILECDVDATRRAYEGLLHGGAEECGCSGCRNFIEQREFVFPAEVLNLFGRLGMNYRRDAEIYHIARMESGSHYGGWFHFVGNILKEPIGPVKIEDRFTIDFLNDRSLAAKSFED